MSIDIGSQLASEVSKWSLGEGLQSAQICLPYGLGSSVWAKGLLSGLEPFL